MTDALLGHIAELLEKIKSCISVIITIENMKKI